MGTVYTLRGFVSIADSIDDQAVVSLEDFGFTSNEVEAAESAHITVYTENILYRYDGSDPELPDEGHIIVADTERVINGTENITALKMIAIQNSADLFITLSTYRPTDP